MSRSRWARGAALLAAVACAGAGCGQAAEDVSAADASAGRAEGSGASAHPDPVRVLRVGVRSYLSNAPLLLAQEAGYFEREGLRVEFVEIPINTSNYIPTLSLGRLDALSAILNVALLNAIVEGAPIRLVADIVHLEPRECPYAALIVRRGLADHGEVDLSRLRGGRIHSTPTGSYGPYLERLFRPAGLTLDEVRTVRLPPGAWLEALAKGTLDGALATEPWKTYLLREGHVPVPTEGAAAEPMQFSVLVFAPYLWRDQPDLGQRFLTAYLRGVRQLSEGKTERNLSALARATGIDRETLAEACWPPVDPDGRIQVESVLEFQEYARLRGWLGRVLEPSEFWAASLVEEAARALDAEAAPVLEAERADAERMDREGTEDPAVDGEEADAAARAVGERPR